MKRSVKLAVATVCLALLACAGGWFYTEVQEKVQKNRLAAQRMHVGCHMKCLSMALLTYHGAHETFPPPAVCDKDGKPLLSWRVLILPFIEQLPLYHKFKLDEPWDSPHNLPLLAEMPTIFDPPDGRNLAEPYVTFAQVIVGEGAAFEQNKSFRIQDDFPDGLGNTLLVVQADRAVPWTKPDDQVFLPKGPLPKLRERAPKVLTKTEKSQIDRYLALEPEWRQLQIVATADAFCDWLKRVLPDILNPSWTPITDVREFLENAAPQNNAGQVVEIAVGTSEWDRLTERRSVLIHKMYGPGQGLTEQELAEYTQLQKLSRAAIDRAYPRPRLAPEELAAVKETLGIKDAGGGK